MDLGEKGKRGRSLVLIATVRAQLRGRREPGSFSRNIRDRDDGADAACMNSSGVSTADAASSLAAHS